MSSRFLTAQDLLGRASQHHGVWAGQAQALPLPYRDGDRINVVILYYHENTNTREEILFPPYHMVKINAQTGEIIESKDCKPADFGVQQEPGEEIKGFGLDPDLSADEYWNSFDRFLEISPAVWELFERDPATLTPQEVDLVAEYNWTYRRLSMEPLIPYYFAVAPDLHSWLSEVLSLSSNGANGTTWDRRS